MNDFIEIDHSRLRSENVSVCAAEKGAKNHKDRSGFSQNWWAARVKDQRGDVLLIITLFWANITQQEFLSIKQAMQKEE